MEKLSSEFGFVRNAVAVSFLILVISLTMFSSAESQPQPAQITESTSTTVPTVISSTYLGGSGNVFSGYDITWTTATDANGNVYIAGDSNAPDFPITANAF